MDNRFRAMSDYLAARTAGGGRSVGTARVDRHGLSSASSAPSAVPEGPRGDSIDDTPVRSAAALRVSPAGIAFISDFEGFLARPSEDAAGHCSVGYGTRLHRGACDAGPSEAPYRNGISRAVASQLLAQELASGESLINGSAGRPLSQQQFDALASLLYGIGPEAFRRSRLATLLSRGDYEAVPAELRRWTRARVAGRLVDLPQLARRREAEVGLWQTGVYGRAQSLDLSCFGVSLSDDKWDRIAKSVFGYASYADYVTGELTSTTFLGRAVSRIGPELVSKLGAAEATLRAAGYAGSPTIDSTFRSKKGMHGWGLAADFEVLTDPYVLNEAGEAALDKDLRAVYDRIADFVLGLPQSSLRKLAQGRAAFNNSIETLYDALSRESRAMQTYFALMNDPSALSGFLAGEWAQAHAGQVAPDAAGIRAQMQKDYETLGGKTAAGAKKPTGSAADRPFAPTSGGGAGDPASGFLNLDKEFVLALTNAGLAWGAIDMGGASGDIMHFDCRLEGNGRKAYQQLVS